MRKVANPNPSSRDHHILDQIRDLKRTLNEGLTVQLTHEHSADQYAEDLRDLGHEFRDLGEALLERVAELDSAHSESDYEQLSE